jgi:Bacterial Ig-like domain
MCDRNRFSTSVLLEQAWIKAGIVLSQALVVASCASVSPPDGGDRDKTPPKSIGSLPKDGSVRVTGKSIVLRFDEPVTTNQLASSLTISPDTDLGTPTVKEKGEELLIEFRNEFAPNTTYFIDFGEGAIIDITEKNKAPRVQLSFSTGATIDSGSVSGKLINSWLDQPESGAIVGLFVASDTVDPTKQQPLYRTLSNEKGEYTLRNIRPGRYRLFGFVDANKSKRYEEPERIAYAGKDLRIGVNDTVVQLISGRLDTRRPFILTQKQAAGQATLTFNEGIHRIAIAGEEGRGITQLRQTADPKTVKLFATAKAQPQKLTIISTDSAGNIGRDTVRLKFADDNGKPAAVRTASIIGQLQSLDDRRSVEFTMPVAAEVRAGIIGELVPAPAAAVATKPKPGEQIDKKPEPTETKPAVIPKTLPSISIQFPGMAVLDSSQSVVTVELPKTLESQAYVLKLDSTAFRLVSQQPLSFRPLPIPARDRDAAETTGTIVAQVQTTKPSYMVDLLTEKGQVVASFSRLQKGSAVQTAPTQVRWPQLAPGRYRVRVLIDADNNGQWDGIDPDYVRQPEPVWFYPEPLEVRANWENEAILTF